MEKKIGFFTDSVGNKSSMRLMSFLVYWLLVAIDVIVLNYGHYKNNAYDQWFVVFFILVNLIFLIAIFYPKYLQKIIELGAANIQRFKDNISPVKPSDVISE